MKILLDTHIILWYFWGSENLPKDWLQIIEDKNNHIYYSSISLSEIGIKYSIGKLGIPNNFLNNFKQLDWIELVFDSNDAKMLYSLPVIHRDPFDRMLISQALSNSFYFMTSDKDIRQYDLKFII
jgi:PIN domain nuclease of toxin-antitoxin system